VQAGETVERLILVDSVNKNAPVSRWRPIIDRIAPPASTQGQFVRRQKALRKFSYYDSRLRAVTAMRGSELARWAVNTVRIRLGGRRAEQVASSPATAASSAPAISAPPRPEREKLLFYSRSSAVYVPRRHVGAVDLVFSSDPTDQATNASDPVAAAQALSAGYATVASGWQSVLPGARIHHIPGPHISLIVENIDKLGACLRECLGVIDQ
jgi:thioesterase domain-containing protein